MTKKEEVEFYSKALEEIIQITEDSVDEALFTLEESPEFCSGKNEQNLPILFKKTNFSPTYLHKLYMELEQQTKSTSSSLHLFNTWANSTQLLDIFSEKKGSKDGFFFTFEGKGVGVNPGPDFLLYLKKRGFTLLNLDYLIVTQEEYPLTQVFDLFAINSELNTIRPKSHHIFAYLPPNLYKNFFKLYSLQEGVDTKAIHSLEHFGNSKEEKEVALFENLRLKYWPSQVDSLSTAFTLKGKEKEVTLAYFSDLCDPVSSLKECTIAICGRGNNLDKNALTEKLEAIAKRFPKALLILSDIDPKHLDSYQEIFQNLQRKTSKNTLPAQDTFSIDVMTCAITLDKFPKPLTPEEILFLPKSNPLQPFIIHPQDLCL